MNQEKTIALLDGNHALRRAYHVMEDLTDPQGNPTGGIFGFLGILKTTIETLCPDRLIVVLDGGLSAWRKQIFPSYKDRSEKNPEKEEERQRKRKAVAWQAQQLQQEVLPLLGLPFIRIPKREADDVIFALRNHAIRPRGHNAIIVSGDKDFLQMVSFDTRVYDPMTKKKALPMQGPPMVHPGNFEEITGFQNPDQFLDYRAMDGDVSDRIPGIPGVGEKTAKKWLLEFGSIRGILNREEDFAKKGKKARTLLDQRRILARNLLLMTLSQHPLPEKLAKYVDLVAHGAVPPVNTQALKEYCIARQALQFAANIQDFVSVIEVQRQRAMSEPWGSQNKEATT